ncbi:Carbamate kinase [hydrothermal vent metagenome]|uniref:Carbamate kinase n=1 Tax=hydrothermal vent metagenome TaxID=652676 RepID=A0A3B1DIU6_9ZZZZ
MHRSARRPVFGGIWFPVLTDASSPTSPPPHAPPRTADPTVVVALGGHAFVQHGESGGHEEHLRNAARICESLMTLVERGYQVVITHGNGPQVGVLLEQDERSRDELPSFPLDVHVAQTEGSLGYYLQQALLNSLRKRDIRRFVVTVITQVIVDADDPAFEKPTKPVGPFLSEADARQREKEFGWIVGEDAGRGWRRLVPSPFPRKIIQRDMIREAAARGHIVVAAGGGGIPVRITPGGDYEGIEAVIDKDSTSSVLARDIRADLLLILTDTECVYLNYQSPDRRSLGAVTLAECARHIRKGHFPPGSMGPKVQAIHDFLLNGGARGLITSPDRLSDALAGEAGTHFIGRI